MGELADKAEIHPLDFRLRHLEDPRAMAVIRRLREIAPDNDKLGFAFSRYKNEDSYVAVAAEVAWSDGKVKVKKLWGVAEAGEIVNPNGMSNQIEGGMLQATSWTLQEQVRWKQSGLHGRDWESYPILRMPEIPEIEVELIDRPDLASLGAGESAQGPTAAAIANAVRRTTGKRVVKLPINDRPLTNP